MAKDQSGHGSERRAIGLVKHSGETHEVHIGPSKASAAQNKGWREAVSFQAPGRNPTLHENMAKAKARLESHPGFAGWKAPRDT